MNFLSGAERIELGSNPDFGACIARSEAMEYCRVANIATVAERWNLTWRTREEPKNTVSVYFHRIGMKTLGIRDYIIHIPNYGSFPVPESVFEEQYIRVEPVDISQGILATEVNRLSTYYTPKSKRVIKREPHKRRGKSRRKSCSKPMPIPPKVIEVKKEAYYE